MTLQTNLYHINLIYEYDAKSMTKCTIVENLNKTIVTFTLNKVDFVYFF